jgi:two-component system NarL family sensor kinase
MRSGTISRINNKRNSDFEFNLINRINEELSAELHDNVASKLSVIRLKLFNNPNEVVETIHLLDTVIASVRQMSHGLYSPAIEYLDFAEAVRDFLSPLHNCISIKIHTNNESFSLNKRTKIILFRIFQEVVNNIIKHSNATKISVYLRSSGSFFYFTVKDNGDGFSGNTTKNNGIGLKNIKYHTYELKAKYKFKSRPNKGTVFIISVPII